MTTRYLGHLKGSALESAIELDLLAEAGVDAVAVNGHLFRRREGQGLPSSLQYVDCSACGTRPGNGRADQQCLGVYVTYRLGAEDLHVPVEFKPAGRKPVTKSVALNTDGLVALARYLEPAPPGERGHAFWHWENPMHPYPCPTCSPRVALGVLALRRRLQGRKELDKQT